MPRPRFFKLDSATDFWIEMSAQQEKTLRFYADHPGIARMMWSLMRSWTAPGGHQGATGKALDLLRKVGTRFLARGQELGAVRTDLPLDFLMEASTAVSEAAGRFVLQESEQYDITDFEKVAAMKLDLLRRLLEPAREPDTEQEAR